MRKLTCIVCEYTYDEENGISKKEISPGTKWEDVSEDFTCPICGATKVNFKEESTGKPSASVAVNEEHGDEMREMSHAEISVLCSSLARGCEKQYLVEQAELYTQLAEYFKSKSSLPVDAGFDDLLVLIEQDLNNGIVKANVAAAEADDRGAKRVLTWSKKVTTILSSLLKRYKANQDNLIGDKRVYVCDICGFLYIGDMPPEICPICKVPKMKILEVQRRSTV